jgi:protein SCO1/2
VAQRTTVDPTTDSQRLLDGGFRLVLAAALVAGLLVVLAGVRALLGGNGGGPVSSAPAGGPVASTQASATGGQPSGGAIDVSAYLLPTPTPAAAINLGDQDERPFRLSDERGEPVLVFFGYTHCPDVCPATVGTIGLAMEAFGAPVRALFVTVDPERDTAAWLREYVRYLPKGFSALTGTQRDIGATAADWGVRYAKVETGTPGEYSMSHTADVFLVDADGLLRARFPFGTSAEAMTATLRRVVAAPVASPTATVPMTTPTTNGTQGPIGGLGVTVISSSVWSGPAGPIIFSLAAAGSPLEDPALAPSLQLATADGSPVGSAVVAVAVQPPGEHRVVYVASVPIASPGAWRIHVSIARGGMTFGGDAPIVALDPGGTAAIGAPAPTVPTPTLSDVGGLAKAITTDPAPDLRLSQTSTSDALAAHQPFVLVIDSWKFKVTSACGRALVMARYLIDRWPDVAFIHLEPLQYDVVTDTPLLRGSLVAPFLTDPAAAWGLGAAPWGPRSMPWVFVVDGNGIIRSKSEGVMGSDDVDVIVSMVAAGH